MSADGGVASVLDAAGRAWIGARERQQDEYAIAEMEGPDGRDLVCVLCDGMGGHAAGEVASRTAVAAAMTSLADTVDQPRHKRLFDALTAANKGVGKAVRADPSLAGMGCTFVAVIVGKGRVDWISVGDSPMWIQEGAQLRRINADHSLKSSLAAQVRRGEISAADAARHPQRNALTSAVMGGAIELYDLQSAELSRPCKLVLASDGLETLSTEEIADIGGDPRQDAASHCRALIEAVKRKNAPKQDNVSVVVICGSTSSATAFPIGFTKGSRPIAVGAAVTAVSIAAVAVALLLNVSPWRDAQAPEAVAVSGPFDEGGQADECVIDSASEENISRACECIAKGKEVKDATNVLIGDETKRRIEECAGDKVAFPEATETPGAKDSTGVGGGAAPNENEPAAPATQSGQGDTAPTPEQTSPPSAVDE